MSKVKIPELHPGDPVMIYNNPSQTKGEVGIVHVANPGGVCDILVTNQSGSSAYLDCFFKHDPVVQTYGPERWTQTRTGVWELTASEKLRRELPIRLTNIEADLAEITIKMNNLAKAKK